MKRPHPYVHTGLGSLKSLEQLYRWPRRYLGTAPLLHSALKSTLTPGEDMGDRTARREPAELVGKQTPDARGEVMR